MAKDLDTNYEYSGEAPPLETIWCEEGLDALKCCACGEKIHPKPLVRTFSLGPKAVDAARKPTKEIAALGRTILIYDRHLECSYSVSYVAVSHVWNATLSKVQNRDGTAAEAEKARSLALASPMLIFDGMSDDLRAGHEMWHDYISVPQWQQDVKQRILGHVATIFQQAAFTLVHLHDVSRGLVQQIRSENSLHERADGVARICNAVWFSRVWTAMEYVRSRETRTMLKDYKLCDGVDDVFLNELHEAWQDIARERGNVHEAEKLARHGLLPWQLGPLLELKSQSRPSFAEAFSMLSKRGCRSDEDFFHALGGILEVEWETQSGYDGYRETCLLFARKCLAKGDYTPLLMSREPFDDDPGRIGMGYHDMEMWSLGTLECAPPSNLCGLSLSPWGNAVLKAEKIGTLCLIKKLPFRDLHPGPLFSRIARMVIDFTGPDVREFVATIGMRLYGQNTEEIHRRLSKEGRYSFLEAKLVQRFNSQVGLIPWDETDQIAYAMGLSTAVLGSCGGLPPMRYLRAQGGLMHLGLRGALLAITCPSCLGTFIFRAALYAPPSEMQGAVAYRIPGLKFSLTPKDGIAVIVKNGRMVGRMVWATPACSCRIVEEVDVQLDDLPTRPLSDYRQNTP